MKENKYLYIILTKTSTKVAKIIRFISGKTYSHSSIASDELLSEMYSICRDYKHSPLPAHFNVEKIHTQVFGLHENIPSEVYRIPVTGLQLDEFKEAINHFILNRTRYVYNVAAFLPMAFHIPYKFKNKFVCSVWVAFILRKIGISLQVNKHPSLIEPEDLRYTENAELIFKGNLKDYPEFMKKKLVHDSNTSSSSISLASAKHVSA